MENPQELEEVFQGYIEDLPKHAPDGVIEVDLDLLQELDLMQVEEDEYIDDALSQSFYVLESYEKLTLFNERFVVWIVPHVNEEVAMTYTLIALNEGQKPHLEMVFSTSGVYNQSHLVLRILERFLEQIEENDDEISTFVE